MFLTSPNNYTFSTGGFDITLNALGTDNVGRNYTQCYTVSGAKLYVYINEPKLGVQILRRVLSGEEAGDMPDTLLDTVYARDYDILCYPTHFTSNAQVYVYAAIPRSESADPTATIVYPTQKIDLFGRIEVAGEDGEKTEQQVGDPDYYYINLGGIISSADDHERRWLSDPHIVQGAINGYIVGDAAAITRGNGQITKEDLDREIKELREFVESSLFFERYSMGEPYQEMTKDPETGELVPKEEHAKDQDGNLLYYTDSEKSEQITTVTDFPVMMPVMNENTAIRLKPKFLGLFSEGWLSAYGVNSKGGGSGSGGGGGTGGGGSFDRLDRWEDYTPEKAGWVLSAALGHELANRDVTITSEKVISALGYTPFNTANFTKANIKTTLGISDWALKAALEFGDLPKMYWADQQVSNVSNALTEPSFGKVKLTNGTKTVTLSIDESGNLHIDKGVYSDSFVSAYGLNASGSGSGGGANVASQTWGDATYTASNALPANLGYAKIENMLTRIATLEGKKFGALASKDSVAWGEVTGKPTFATVATSGKYSDLSGTPTSLPASDVSAWAKAATKPSYGWNEITGKPTSMPASDVYAWAKASVRPTYKYGDSDLQGFGTLATKNSLAFSEVTGSVAFTQLPKMYWANVEVSNSSSTGTKPTFGNTTVGGTLTVSNGTKSVSISVDASGYLHVSGGVYSDSFVSAYGLNASGGGGGASVSPSSWTSAAAFTSSLALASNLGWDLHSRVQTLENAPKGGVTSFGTKTGAITVRGGLTANGSVNLAMSNNELQASIVGLGALAYKASLSASDVGALAATHPASGVTAAKITNWDTAYGWGNHASAGYVTTGTQQTIYGVKNFYTDSNKSPLIISRLGSYDTENLKIGLDDANLYFIHTQDETFANFVFRGIWTDTERGGGKNAGSAQVNFNFSSGGASITIGNYTVYHTGNLPAYPTTLPASDVYAWAKAVTKPSYTKSEVGLGNVENTALSTWAGTTNITTLGTITSGTWHGSKIANDYLANSAITIAGTSVSLGSSITAGTLIKGLGYAGLKTIWGQQYWSDGPKDAIVGDMSSVGNISFSGTGKNIGGVAYFDTTNKRLGIGGDAAYFYYDATNKCIRTNVGFAADTFVSAYGVNSAAKFADISADRLTLNGPLGAPSCSIDSSSGSLWLNGYSSVGVSVFAGSGTVTPVKIDSNGLTIQTTGTGDTPMLIFQRGSYTDNYNDWAILDSGGWLYFRNRGLNSTGWTNSAYIKSDGNMWIWGSLTQSSDRRLKANISTLEYRGALRPVEFDMRGSHKIGFIAQEVRELYPELVSGEETDEEYLSLAYGEITAVLAAQANNHEERIKVLEKENETLHKRIVELENR